MPELPAEPQPGLIDFIKEIFKDRLVIILLVSAAISATLSVIEGDNSVAAYAEPAVILLILLLNGIVQVVQDLKTENAIQVYMAMPDLAGVSANHIFRH